jgi:hypothetical protein
MSWTPLGPDGAWFVSGCHGDRVSWATAAAGAEALRGEGGVSRGSDCALTMSGRVSNQTNEIAISVKAQMFLPFIFPPSFIAHSLFSKKEVGGPINLRTTTGETSSSRFGDQSAKPAPEDCEIKRAFHTGKCGATIYARFRLIVNIQNSGHSGRHPAGSGARFRLHDSRQCS